MPLAKKGDKPVGPFMVQACRDKKQHGLAWVTDSRHDDLEVAKQACDIFFEKWARRCRVQDQNEVIWYKRELKEGK